MTSDTGGADGGSTRPATLITTFKYDGNVPDTARVLISLMDSRGGFMNDLPAEGSGPLPNS